MTRTAFFPIEFAVTPRFDVFYALYTLTGSAPSPLDPWKEKAIGRLSRDFDRVAKRVAPLPIFWPLLADAIQGVPGEIAFDEILSTVREMPVEDLRRNVLAGIFHDSETVDALVAGGRTLRDIVTDDRLPADDLLGHFGLRPFNANAPATSAITTLLTRAESFRDALGLVLQKFWLSGFKGDWLALEPRLRAESFRLSDLQEERSLGDLANELNLPMTFDDGAREARPRSGPAIEYDRIDRCYIIPSAFNTRRWWAKYETGAQRIALYLPIMREAGAPNEIARDRSKTSDAGAKHRRAINAESVFRALGDTTRYAIASILARTPTTSAELARSLNVSKPTITHHVQALRSAGLITDTPAGGSIKLSLSRDTVAELSRAAVDQLFSSTGDLTLVTTRKRRNA